MSAMKHWENKFVELHELHKDNSADSLARLAKQNRNCSLFMRSI
jgi:hypothetical protein